VKNNHPPDPSTTSPAPTLFASPEEVERAKAAVIASKRDEPKVTLPDIVPGYKANPLDAGEKFTLYLFHGLVVSFHIHTRQSMLLGVPFLDASLRLQFWSQSNRLGC